jgi:hypothetical protein
MSVTDSKMHKDAQSARHVLVFPIITATSQNDVKAASYKPKYAFQVVDAQVYCRTEAGTVTADVKIGTASVLSGAMAFATGSRVDGVLSSTLTAVRGTSAEELNIHFTSDGTGALTNGFVFVTIRPVGLSGEVAFA